MIQKDDPRLTAYVVGELDDADCQEIESALEQSAELRQEVEAIRQMTVLLSDGLQIESRPQLTSQQHAAIKAQAAEPTVSLADPPPLQQRMGRSRYTAAIMASITLASLLCILAILNRDPSGSVVRLTTSEHQRSEAVVRQRQSRYGADREYGNLAAGQQETESAVSDGMHAMEEEGLAGFIGETELNRSLYDIKENEDGGGLTPDMSSFAIDASSVPFGLDE